MYMSDKSKVDNVEDKANYLNKYHCKVGLKLTDNLKIPTNANINASNELLQMNANTVFIKPSNESKFKRIIINLKDKSGGVDNIKSNNFKKVLLDYIARPCLYLQMHRMGSLA